MGMMKEDSRSVLGFSFWVFRFGFALSVLRYPCTLSVLVGLARRVNSQRPCRIATLLRDNEDPERKRKKRKTQNGNVKRKTENGKNQSHGVTEPDGLRRRHASGA
jgi:hypothetical protein